MLVGKYPSSASKFVIDVGGGAILLAVKKSVSARSTSFCAAVPL